MTNKKPTKKTLFTTILDVIDYVEANDVALSNEEVTYADLRAALENELNILENKKLAAAKRAADKKAAGDELRERVFSVMDTENFMTAEEIVAAIDDADVTRAMVVSRLTQLIDLERAKKEFITVNAATEGGKSRKVTAYCAII